MTMSFLASVRRNQRQWMVVVTILAIFAFLIDDVRGASSLSTNSMAFFFGVLCAAGMAIIGYPRRHTVLFGIIGFVVGGSAAWIGGTYSAPKPPVATKFGSLTKDKLTELGNTRAKANRFLATVVEKVNKEARAPYFDTSISSLVHFSVLRHEADRLGISVSDEAVNQYIQEATQNKLTEKDYLAALKETGLGESNLFNILRSELEVQLLGRLLSPPSNVQQLIPMFTSNRMGARTAQMTPEQLWDNFRKLNVRQSLTSVAIPVTEFIKPELVAEPSESELREYFDKRKSIRGDDRGNPGFLEMPKVKLAYLKAHDLEAYEKGIREATDQEVVDYYLAHKEEYRVFDFPEPDSTDPDSTVPDLKSGAESIDNYAPADAASPVNVTAKSTDAPAPVVPPATEKPAAQTPAEPKEADKPPTPENKVPNETAPEKKADETPATEKKPSTEKKPAPAEEEPKEEPKCGDDPADEAKEKAVASDEAAAKSESVEADAAKPAAENKPAAEPEAAKPTTKENADATPPAPALPSTDDVDAVPALSPLLPPGAGVLAPQSGPKAPAQPGTAPPVRYRELDADLKLQIREKILLEKAFGQMGNAADDAFQFMIELSMKYMSAEKADRAKLAASFADECKAYAVKNGLEYHETKEMTQTELATSLDERIGSAGEAVSEQSVRRDVRRVSDMVFEGDGTGRSRMGLYAPQRADSPKEKYAYWKIAEIPSKVPDLADKATRQLVVNSWKFEKARELAEKRAQEVAALVKAAPADITAALSGQTINGTKDSPALTVREIPTFSWMRVSQSVPSMGLQFPMESFVEGIDQPGSDFFRLVFDQLSEGEVGVALNRPRTVFYVVRVHDRDGSGGDGGIALQELQQQFLKERFTSQFPTPYDFMASEAQQFVDLRWQQSFSKQFGITFEEGDMRNPDDE